jgi:hypothetical protein
MNSLEQLARYLGLVERRLRLLALARGAAATLGAALVFTVAGVLVANGFAFSAPSVLASRLVLFLAMAFALALGLVLPLIRLNRRRAACEAEQRFPEFEERLLTFTERLEADPGDPFLPLLAADSLEVAERAEPDRVAARTWILGFVVAGLGSLAVLVWLGTAGPGFLGYGTSLLWAGVPRGGDRPFYDVAVEPGNRTVRRRSDQIITARLVGFRSERVRLMARYASSSKWEQADMRPQAGGPGYEFLLAGVPESLAYYVDAGGVRSKTYHFNVKDLPSVKRIRVTYHYPPWTGMKDAVEDPGGDLRAVEGTAADVAVETDLPLENGTLLLDDGSRLPLRREGGRQVARVPIQRDGLYHVALADQGENVRLSEDYFIEAQKDTPPKVRIARPGRDAKVSPIEEVTVAVEGGDNFGLRELSLHYSVNAGPEKAVSLLGKPGERSAKGSSTLYLEDYKLAPGDIVSLYATARGARFTSRTDIFFLEAQPFQKEYSQSQQSGGGQQGGEGGEQSQISQRQKEIIAATWNQIKDTSGEKGAAAENGRFLSGVQSKLRDQARSLVNRMRSREVAGENEFAKNFAQDMDQAIAAMGPAADKLKGLEWQPALGPEQKALQYLLRAEATFRNIQVAFGNRGGGGGGMRGGAQRELEALFDLELDTEKNQYETGQQAASADQRQRDMDEALTRLEQLARRQQELAEQQRRNQQMSQQRWQQETLRREAEQLQRQMEQLSRQSSQGAQGQAGQGGQQSAAMERAIERLQQALGDMRQAASQQQGGNGQSSAGARRAAERLQEARDLLSGMRQEQAGAQMDRLVRQSERLSGQQRDFGNKLRQAFGGSDPSDRNSQPGPPGVTRQQAEQLAGEKDRMAEDLKKLEAEMQKTVRDLASGQRPAATKLRDALGNMQQEELGARMRQTSDFLRRGLGSYAVMRESVTTQALGEVADQIREAQKALAGGQQQPNGQKGLEEALAQTERLRRQMEQALGQGDKGQGAGGQGTGDRQPQGAGGQGTGDRGQQARGGGQYGGGGRSGLYQGGGEAPRTDPQALERAFQDGLRDLGRLERAVADNPEIAGRVTDLLSQMRRIDLNRFADNPELLSRLNSQVLTHVQGIELELRRMLDEQQGGQVRSSTGEPVSPAYADAVAEYFRRLSQNKP